MNTENTSSITNVILIDGFRHDMLDNKTPFLTKKADQGVTGILEPPLGYCLHPTWFAGLYPESSDRFLQHIYSQQSSNNKPLKLVSLLQRNRSTRLPAGFAIHRFLHSSYEFAPFIPFTMLKYFDVAEKLPPWHPQYLTQVTTLFDILREEQLKWLFIGSPGSDQRTLSILNKYKKMISKEHSFIWLHFAELDWASHKFGPESAQSKEKLKEIDKTVEKIHLHLSHTHTEVNTLVFGDHGHVEVNKTIDLKKLLKQTSSRMGEDYIYFLDSTIARFWFKNERARNEITDILSSITHGKVLSKDDLIKYRCNFQDSKHGQLMWIANEGCIILPNFWQGTTIVRGMHGYLPEVRSNHSRFVISGLKVSRPAIIEGKFMLVDLFPTLLDMMGLPTPKTNEGSSILHYADRN